MRVYLAGPINGTSDDEANDWRALAASLLGGHEVLDPMVRDYRGDEHAFVGDIVAGDLADISSADVILANYWKPSYGTAMELVYATAWGKRVVVMLPEGPVSPWLAYHSDVVVHAMGEAVDAVLRQPLH